MARDFTEYVGVRCTDCGIHGEGVTADDGRTRCGQCGKFAEEIDDYCAEHDVNYGRISGYDHCPMCREENRIRQAEQEMMARRADPQMHSMIDAPRY